MATRHTPSDYEVVLAVQASSRDSAAIETVSEVLDPDSPTGRSSEIRGGNVEPHLGGHEPARAAADGFQASGGERSCSVSGF